MYKNNFDFLRYLFASIVILAHIFELTNHIHKLHYLGLIDSFIPVSGFFVISGFLISKSYSLSKNIIDYLSKRAMRLLPAYTFIIIIPALAFSTISILGFSNYFTNVQLYKYLISNLIFLNFLHPCLPGVFNTNSMCAINGSLWTIKVEVGFYLFLPILYYVIKRNSKFIILVGLYFVGLLYNYILYKIFQKTNGDAGLYFTLTHQLPSLMIYFIAGMVLHFYFDFIWKHKGKLLFVAVPIFMIEYIYEYQVFKPLALGIIVFYLAYSFKIFNNFGKYGDFSYGVYIFHFPVIQLFIHYGFFDKYNAWGVLLTILIVVNVLAILSWYLIEKRFLNKRKIEKQLS